MAKIDKCILCNETCEILPQINGKALYECSNCGNFEIPIAEIPLLENNDEFKSKKHILSGIISNKTISNNEKVQINSNNWNSIINENGVPYKFEDISFLLLEKLYQLSKGSTEIVDLKNITPSMIYAKDKNEMISHLDDLIDRSYVKAEKIGTANAALIYSNIQLTPKGIRNVENRNISNIKSNDNIENENRNYDKINKLIKPKKQTENDIEQIIIPNKISINENGYTPKLNIELITESFAKLINNINGSQNRGLFGILGRWGRGKTYLLNFLKEELKKDKSVDSQIIDFSAWKYQKAPELWAHLYETFAQIKFSGKGKVFKIFLYNCKRYAFQTIIKIIIPIFWLIILLLIRESITFKHSIYKIYFFIFTFLPPLLYALTKILIVRLKDSYDLAKLFLKKMFIRTSYSDILGLQNDIQQELLSLLKNWIPDKKVNKKQIVLVVDDLDRCKPENILEFIDSLRVILDENEISNRLKVVLALDHDILRIILQKHYNECFIRESTHLSIDDYIRMYFDKAFLFAIYLSPLNDMQREEIISNIYESNNQTEVDIENQNTIKSETTKKYPIESKMKKIEKEIKDELVIDSNLQMSKDEIILFKEIFKKLSCTPRRLRIIYYRYLFLKKIYMKINPSNSDNYVIKEILNFLKEHELNNTMKEEDVAIDIDYSILEMVCYD